LFREDRFRAIQKILIAEEKSKKSADGFSDLKKGA
jgi:hypothetical protein